MATVKRIVCLANSRKLNHRCVAGKIIEGSGRGQWIRPVSTRENGELTLSDRRYDDGGDPRVMDVMDVPLGLPVPKGCQQENWSVVPAKSPMRVRQASWAELQGIADPQEPLWVNGHSTKQGLNDAMPVEVANAQPSSLRLIRVPKLDVEVLTYFDKKRVQGRFGHAGTEYWLWITDPVYELKFKAGAEGHFTIGESYLTVSVGKPFVEKNACYKLIAAIIERPGGGKV